MIYYFAFFKLALLASFQEQETPDSEEGDDVFQEEASERQSFDSGASKHDKIGMIND